MVKLFFYKYLQVFTSIIAILALYVSCPSGAGGGAGGGVGGDIEPPDVRHSIAVTEAGTSLTLTVTATDLLSGIAAYSRPVLSLDGVPVKPFNVQDTGNIWVYTIKPSDVGKTVSYSNISATDGADNKSGLEGNSNTGILAGLEHTLTVYDPENSGETTATEGDIIRLRIIAAQFEGKSYTYDGSITIGDVTVVEEPRGPGVPSNVLNYKIGPDHKGAVRYSASVTPSWSDTIVDEGKAFPNKSVGVTPSLGDTIVIAKDSLSGIIVIDITAPVFTAALTTSGGGDFATTGDTLSLTVNASDGKGLASATATLKVGTDILQSETIEVPTVDVEPVKTFTFGFEKIVDASNRGLVSYSIVVTNVDGKTSVTNPEYTPSSITANPDGLLTTRIVGFDVDGVTEKTTLKAGDIIRLTTRLVVDPSTETIVYNPSLKIGGMEKDFIQKDPDSEGRAVFEYVVVGNPLDVSDNGAVTYSVEPTINGVPVDQNLIDQASGITVDTALPIINSTLTVSRNNQPVNGYLQIGDKLELIVGGSDGSGGVYNGAEVWIGTKSVSIEYIGLSYLYTVKSGDEGVVSYRASVTDLAGNITTSEVIDTGFMCAYHIYNFYDLTVFADAVNKGKTFAGIAVVLNNNITIADGDYSNFSGIAIRNSAFSGIFDGNKKTISNMKIKEWGKTPIGFFGYVENATIKDLTIASGWVKGYQYVGGIVGKALNSTITGVRTEDGLGVSAEGWDYSADTKSQSYVGGIVGQSSGTTISHVYNKAWVTGRSYVGGIVGFMNSTTIQYAYNTGVLVGTEDALRAEMGGIIGHVNGRGSTVSHVYNIGRFETKQAVDMGGIIGLVQYTGTTLSHAFNQFNTAPEGGRNRGQIIGRVFGVNVSEDTVNSILTAPIYYYKHDANVDIKAIGIIGDRISDASGNQIGEFTPSFANSFTFGKSANFFISNVFDNDIANWIKNNTAGSYPTLRYFEGWD